MNKMFRYDYYRMTGKEYKLCFKSIIEILFKHNLKYMWVIRKLQAPSCKLTKKVFEVYRYCLGKKYGIDFHADTSVGKGFAMFHAYCITINPRCVIGNNVNIAKGATLGASMRGKYSGCPTIGNKVYIGINSTIVGNVKIGNNVIIAPNAYVNRDIPDNSVAVGNPAVVYPRDNATDGYINFTV